MNAQQLRQRFVELCREEVPIAGRGLTAERFLRIFEVGREDLSLAKLIEAHWDAIAILAEAAREPALGAKYAVWASERPGAALRLVTEGNDFFVEGRKEFCTGSGLVDRALITAEGDQLLEVDLLARPDLYEMDESAWQVDAFRMTHTSTVTFKRYPVISLIGKPGWYVARTGFWQGAVGPASAWAGGASGLVDFAAGSKRDDPHTRAHVGAMHAQIWAMKKLLRAAGDDFDRAPSANAMIPALMLRHMVEQACSDVLHRFARAMGPVPLALNPETARRYAELDLYLRQSHAERDLESLGRALRDA